MDNEGQKKLQMPTQLLMAFSTEIESLLQVMFELIHEQRIPEDSSEVDKNMFINTHKIFAAFERYANDCNSLQF